jgi:hypothetical protein
LSLPKCGARNWVYTVAGLEKDIVYVASNR